MNSQQIPQFTISGERFAPHLRAFGIIIFLIAGLCVESSFGQANLLGAPGVMPSQDHPIGWRGDWSGRFPGATPPVDWTRRVKGITTELKYQANKPSGEPGKGSFPLEYF